jgi:hypothetical protein
MAREVFEIFLVSDSVLALLLIGMVIVNSVWDATTSLIGWLSRLSGHRLD